MLEQNRPIHEFTGVARFHAAGYTGSRARAATGEVLVPEDWDGPGHVETLVQDGKKSTGSHDMYRTGEYMIWTDGTIQRCKQDTNYSPEEYPQAWEIYSE